MHTALLVNKQALNSLMLGYAEPRQASLLSRRITFNFKPQNMRLSAAGWLQSACWLLMSNEVTDKALILVDWLQETSNQTSTTTAAHLPT